MLNRNIVQLCKDLNHKFNRIEHLQLALTHRSMGEVNNQRLEFLGDSILDLVICTELYNRFPKYNEGDLSIVKSNLVKSKTLTEIALEIDLKSNLIMNLTDPIDLKKFNNLEHTSILPDTLEAAFGAVYIDGGYQSAEQSILSVYKSRLQDSMLLLNYTMIHNFKTQLQIYLDSLKIPNPIYLEIFKCNATPTFTAECKVDGVTPTVGTARTRKKAEEIAAEAMLHNLKKIHST